MDTGVYIALDYEVSACHPSYCEHKTHIDISARRHMKVDVFSRIIYLLFLSSRSYR